MLRYLIENKMCTDRFSDEEMNLKITVGKVELTPNKALLRYLKGNGQRRAAGPTPSSHPHSCINIPISVKPLCGCQISMKKSVVIPHQLLY